MDHLQIRLKRLGKKRLRTVPVKLSGPVADLDGLLRACVASEVARFNASREEPKFVSFLTPAEIGRRSRGGKVTFGDVSNPETADVETATEVALQAWKDGVFVVFVDDEEIKELTTPLSLDKDSVVTFLRLTFLTGTMW